MAGTVGVVNGVAMYTGDGINDGIYYLDVGGLDFSNLRLQMHVLAVEDTTSAAGVGLRFRRSDENNWWEFGMSATSTEYVLRKKVAGTEFTVAEPNLTRGAGDILKVEAYEERINCYVNETLVISITDTDLMNNTNMGLRFSALCVDSAVDDFYALVLEEDIRQYITFFPEYEFFIDWDQDGGLSLGEFELEENVDEWETYGSQLPTISQSDLFVRSGSKSLEIDWIKWAPFQFDVSGRGFDQGTFGGPEYQNPPNPFKFDQAGQGFDDGRFAVVKVDNSPTTIEANFVAPGIRKTMTNLVPGRVYTLKSWIYTPEFGTMTTLGVEGIGGTSSTLWNTWELVEYTYTATATEHNVILQSTDTNPEHASITYIDEVMNIGAYEDISCYVIGNRGSIDFRFGRDHARSLGSISPGEVKLELDNETGIFSPDNPGSVLAGFLAPGKPVLIRATYNNQSVNLFHGFVDDYVLHPEVHDRSVTMTAMDALQFLSNAEISTELYPSIQTGEAIEVILDQVGWPETKRHIDQGATTVRWWWEEGTSGLEAIQKLCESEGLPAIAHVDAFGNFVFRSRHHRLRLTASRSIQAYIRSCAEFDEPNFSDPLTYDIGWKDIINQIQVEVEERMPQQIDEVWSQDDWVSIKAGETYTLNISTSDPFYQAVLPSVENGDITLKTGSGSLSEVNMTRTSGASTTITLTAGASDVTVTKIILRANSVEVAQKKKVVREDSTSVATYGPQTEGGSSDNFHWVNVNDMDAIAQIILGQRAERLPVAHIDLNNGHPIRISHLLNRQLSDRIHIEEMQQTFMNDDYFIEVLEHSIENQGSVHKLTLGCEKAREQLAVDPDETPANVFTFNDASRGFDAGVFAPGGEGFTLSNDLFILGQSKLDEDGLGF